jgi:uncharacterized protein YkwD
VKILQGAFATVALVIAGCAHAPNAGPPSPGPRDPAADQVMSLDNFDHALLSRAILWETNRVRIGHELPPLATSAALDAAADEQATYTALSLMAGHANPIPGEHDAGDRTLRQGLHPKRVAENAIMMPAHRPPGEERRNYTYGEYATFLLEGWMNSPDHRANILDPRFTYLGCAARPGRGFGSRDQRIFAVQVFFLPESGAGPLPAQP